MPDWMDAVAKARIVLRRDGEDWSLLSRKRAEGTDRHGLLEMLGGHVEVGETPEQALLRELREEERSGTLAKLFSVRDLSFRTRIVDTDPHHLFDLRLPAKKAERVVADPAESLGFEWVRTVDVESGKHWKRLTYRTQQIIEVFGPCKLVRT